MSFVYEERSSDLPFVEAIWRTEDTADGTYLAAADGAWDMIFTKEAGHTTVLLSGPSSKAIPVPYKVGNRNFGVRFRPGAFMAQVSAENMLNVTSPLPTSSSRSFWFQGESHELPTYDNVDTYLQKLVQKRLLNHDNVVTAVLGGMRPDISDRTVQRHFRHVTGLSPRGLVNIRRANRAVALLQGGMAIRDVVMELGYADQAHMTRQVKQISGCTPGEIVTKVDMTCRLHSIQGYGVCAQMKVQNFKGGFYGDSSIQAIYPPGAARRIND
jgi:AraC-like DNA-binding protein